MSATNPQPQDSPLKVVPPKARAKAPAPEPKSPPVAPIPEPVAPSPAQAPAAQAPAKPKPYGKWFLTLLLLAGVGAIARMPITNYVTGEGEITSRVNAREQITMPIAGKVTLQVESNEQVNAGEVVAEISSPEIDNQIAAAESTLQQAESALSAANKRLTIAQTELENAKEGEAIARDRAAKKQAEIDSIISGEKQPKIRQIEREIDGIKSEIAGIRNVISGFESEITGIQSEMATIDSEKLALQEQLSLVEKDLTEYLKLAEEGALARNGKELRDLQMQKVQFQSQIQQQDHQLEVKRQQIRQKESEIRQHKNLIDQKYQLIGAKSEQINDVKKQMEEMRDERENDIQPHVAARRSAKKEVEAAEAAIASEMERVTQAQGEISRLQNRERELILNAETTGTVLTEKIDLMNKNTLQVGDIILEIADLGQLTGAIKVPQEEVNLVKKGQSVIFKTSDPYSPKYKAKVQDISSRIQAKEAGTNPMLTVTILIDNRNNILRPGMEGFAHIETGEMRIYQKVQHELNKLFEFDKYFPWFSQE
ncbi:HlyD family efflux transporter periplasmic adaptor subunit [Phormidium sp. CCY1219]|uniref:HlyD family efflux transporter periplasmic adaptor subunit n=1 Tax=Phormidium sp. CCY1219 TaxID=2886104 RepID=UPI002D1EBB13|nr:HlyD family efflux transporter periplasmic adaptor subunit [Phormidium sp. CCY1219]MEB3826243.1 HlyD family efflux transporter periplasmic adaptor subunit [Phormidium sp. CCY1219]